MEGVRSAIEKIITDLTKEIRFFIENFKKLTGNYSSGPSLEDIHYMSQILSEMNQRSLSAGNASGQGSSGLDNISRLAIEFQEKSYQLEQATNRLNETLSIFRNDAQPGEIVEILKLKKVKKMIGIDDEISQWVLEVRSHPNCEKNFRNVEIWDFLNDIKITEFKLIEPKVILKVVIKEEDLLSSNYLVAKIGKMVISKPYLIHSVNVSVSLKDDRFEVQIENWFNEDLDDLSLNFNGKLIKENFTLSGGQTLYETEVKTSDSVVAYVLQKEKLVSNTYSGKPQQRPLIPSFDFQVPLIPSLDIQMSAEDIILTIQQRYNHLSGEFIQYFINNYPNHKVEDLIEQLKLEGYL